MMRVLFPMLILFGCLSTALAQPCGLQDTLMINQNSEPDFAFEVFNIFNDDLSDPAQGVCGVEIHFAHQFIKNLELSLTSPSGQTVQLIGPNNDESIPFTFFANWDITFVPCSATAQPDPGFLQQWNNTQPGDFVSGGQYDGSYYPFMGCLEDFNTGPANGTWTINVENNPSVYPGAIVGFRIIFCDERGLDCCFAASGNLLQDDILSCEGDSSLIFQPLPSYQGTPPDTVNYGYTYVIGQDSILMAYDSTLNLTGFEPGRYQICGFSYQRADRDSFLTPNDTLTIDSLRRNLNSLEPDFCGEITDSCIWVEVVAPPDTTFLLQTICEGDTLIVGDSSLVSTGLYDITLAGYGGCDSIVRADLTVLPTVFTNLDTTICAGQPFAVGDSLYTFSGAYQDTLLSATLCDSIVNLQLTVLDTAFFDTTLTICQGDAFLAGDSLLTQTGFYEIPLASAQGCDSIVRADLTVIDISAAIAPPEDITCAAPTVLLDGSASGPAGALAYGWRELSGLPLGNASTQSVGLPGTYILEVSRTENGVSCLALDTITVAIDTIPPDADAGPAQAITCTDTLLTLGGSGTTISPDVAYEWSTASGNILGDNFNPTAEVDAPGSYILTATDIDSRCSTSDTVSIVLDQALPIVLPGPDTVLNCRFPAVTLDAGTSSSGPGFVYSWTRQDGLVPEGGDGLSPDITLGGLYQLLIQDTSNGCRDSASVLVAYDTLSPNVSILPPDTLNCVQTSISLLAVASDTGNAPLLLWSTPDGNLLSGANSLNALADEPGTYSFVAERAGNGCRDSAAVEVIEEVNTLIAEAGPADTLTCLQEELTLDGSNSQASLNTVFQWSTTDGQFAADSSAPIVNIVAPGTYQLLLTDTVTQCFSMDSVTIAQDTLRPIAMAGPNRTITCDSSTVTLDGSGSSTGPGFDYDWLRVEDTDLVAVSTLSPEVSQAGTYLLIVTDAATGCFDSASVVVNQNVLSPEIEIAPPALLNCEAQSLTLDASGSAAGPEFSYSWTASMGGAILSGADTPSPLIGSTGRYHLLIENDSTGCSGQAFVMVNDTINQITALAAAADTLSCSLQQTTLSADSSLNGADVIYDWSTTDGLLPGSTSGANVTAAEAGTYQLIALDTFTRCADTSTLFLPLDTLPPLAEAGSGFELNCSVLQGTLDGSASQSGADILYQWSGPCLTSDSDTSLVTVDCPGTYFLMLTDATNGCTATDSVIVTQEADIPSAQINGSYAISCDSLTQTIDATGSSQGTDLVYSWSGPGILSGANTLSPTVGSGGAYTLSVEDTANTCISTATLTVAWDTLSPIANAGIVEVINCDSSVVQIGGVESSMGPEYTYAWSGPAGGFQGAPDAAFVNVTLPGTYTLIVADTTNGCSASSQTTVFEGTTPPNVDAGPDGQLDCATPIVTLDGSNSPATANISYQWSGPCLQGATDAPVVEADCEGLYILTLFDEATGCSASDSVTVTRDPLLPLASLPDSLELSCSTGTAVIDASASDGDTFSWFFNGNPAPLSGLTPTVDSAGLYTLIAANAQQNCFDTASTVVILDCAANALLATPDTLSCAVTEVIIDGTASSQGPAIEYEWVAPAAPCLISGQGTPSATVSCPGAYTLIVTNTVLSLTDSATVIVAENTSPPLAEAGAPLLLTCDQPVGMLSANGSSSGSNIGYSWTKLDDETFRKDSFNIQVDDDGTYFLTVIDSLTGCTAEDIVSVQRSDEQHDVNFGSLIIPCLEESYWLQAFVSPAGPDYQFSWAGSVIISAPDSSAVLLDTAGMVAVTVVNPDNNCVTVRQVDVLQQDCIPCIEIGPVDSLTCVVDTVALTASFCEPCPGCELQWTGPAGGLTGPVNGLQALATQPGVYTLTATDTLGFSSVENIIVTENTVPPIIDAGPNATLSCATTTVTVGPAAPDPLLSYQWSDSNGLLTGDTLSTLSVSYPDTFLLQATNRGTGCQASDLVAVQIDTLPPVADAGPDRQLDCDNESISLDGSGSDFGNSLTYQWTGPAGGNIAGPNTFNPTVNSPGWYTLVVADTLNGCSQSDSVFVEAATGLPAVPTFQADTLNCDQPALTLNGALPAPQGFSSCWFPVDEAGNPTGPCSTGLQLEVSAGGSYQFEVTNDSTGCSDRSTVSIAEDFTTPLISLPDSLELLCEPDSLLLNPGVSPAGNYEFAWSGPSGVVVSGAEQAPVYVSAPGTYTLQAENLSNGCQAEASVVIIENDGQPQLSMGADTSLNCNQPQIRLSASFTTVSGNATLQWESPDGNILEGSTAENPLIDAPGQYILTLTDPQNGCQAQDTLTVADAFLQPTAAIVPTERSLNCIRDSVLLDATPSLSGSGDSLLYEWRRGAFDVIGSGLQQWVTVAGTYRLIVTDTGSGCRDTLQLPVSADFEEPELLLPDPLRITCERETVTLDPSGSSEGPDFSFFWLGPDGDTISGAPFILTVSEPGTYELILQNTMNGCESRRSVEVESDGDIPEVVIATPNVLDCDRTSALLDGQGSSLGNNFSYAWSTTNGALFGPTDGLTAAAGAPGWYTFTVTNTLSGCSRSDSVEVIQSFDIISNAQWIIEPPTCPGDRDGRITLDSVFGGTPPFFVSFQGGPFTAEDRFDNLAPGDYTLAVEGAGGCEWDGLIVIPEAAGASVDLGPEVTIVLGQRDTLTAIPDPAGIDSISWWPDDGLRLPPLSYIVAPVQTTLYQATIITEDGCRANGSVLVKVLDETPVYVPNVFSPNGDEQNDRFMVFAGPEVSEIAVFRVFDRWGNMVHEATRFAPNDPAFGWDGNFQGYEMDPAVFVYYIELELPNGQREVLRGDVLLMR